MLRCFKGSVRMKYLCQLLLWSFLGTGFEWACAQNAEGFVNEILSEYRSVDQAGRADTSRDGFVTHQEFAQSLYQNADVEGNNDNGVTVNEFVGHYVQHYNISSELAIFMFDLLNDPANNDNKITPNDITLRSFLGRDYASVKEYRGALHKWVTQAANRLYNVLTSPHIIDRSNDLSPRYDILSNIDTNGDGFISYQELEQEFQKFSSSQGSGVHVNRNSWIERNVHSYGADPVTSILTFDYWDRNGDLAITSGDFQIANLELDRNGDGRIRREEYLQYFERGYKLSKRISGKSIQLPKRACPAPWWSKLRASPSLDATRAAMDFDDDFDGWVSVDNVRRWLMLFDKDGDGFLSRNEYTVQHTSRYGVNSTIASSMFDLTDTNGDDRIGEDDWSGHFKDRIEISFCDARRSILDLARMAEKFIDVPQASVKRTSMQERLKEEWDWFVQNEQASGWMALDPYSHAHYLQNGLCQGNTACYEGEQTKAWGLPGASLWWIQGVVSDWSASMDNMAQITGGPLFAEVLPAVLMRGPLPYKRATDSPSSQIQGSDQNPRQISGLGMPSSSQPNGNSNFQFGGGSFGQFPNMNSNKGQRQMENPLMKQYQRLFNQQSSFVPQGVVGVTNPMGFDASNDRTGAGSDFNFGSQRFPDKQTPNLGPMHRDEGSFRTANQDQTIRPTAQPWSPSKTMNVDDNRGSMVNLPMQNHLPQNSQLPFIGLSAYPLVLSLDPSASMMWRTMTRRRKALPGKLDNSIEGKASTLGDILGVLNQRQRRDKDSVLENTGTSAQENDTDLNFNNMQWHPMMTGFSPSPLDIWMSWAMEKFIWENEHTDSNSTEFTNETQEELNDLENVWNEMGMFPDDENLAGDKNQGNDLDGEENSSDSRQKRNVNDSSGTSDGRHKRWIMYVKRLRRNPYLYAMRNLWPRYYCIPPFDFFHLRYRARSPSFWHPCYMYNTMPWSRGIVFPYQTWMQTKYRLVKRNRRDAAESESVVDDLNKKRAFSFDNWFKNKQDKTKPFSKPNNNRYMSQIPSTNAWKTVESSNYGMKNNWGQHLEEESRQWGSKTEGTYDYNSNGKWRNNQMPNHKGGYSAPPPYSPSNGRYQSFSGAGGDRQWDMSGPNAPQQEMHWMDPYNNANPSNYAAFLMPSLVGMSWNKRKIDNGPRQGYANQMDNKYKHHKNFPSMAGGLHQGDWKQRDFSPYRHQWSDAPWEPSNNPSSYHDMFYQGPFNMWNRRFIRKSKDNANNRKDINQSDTVIDRSKRKTRSVKNVDYYRPNDLKTFVKNIKNKKMSTVRAASWMPWESWKMLKSKMDASVGGDNSVSVDSKASFVSNVRHKRSDEGRLRRWGFDNSMWYGNGWNQWMNNQWNPWYNNYMRFARESDDPESTDQDITREKRDADEETPRQKRFGMWNMMNPWSGQGNWNGMWNRLYPRNNWYRWNYMRYPRDSAGKADDEGMERTKRAAEDNDRTKRWGYGNPMWFGNGQNWNQWMNNQWNPWYNNYMRFARESDGSVTDDKTDKEIEKRAADEDTPRQKRFGMWNMMNPWSGHGNWNGMWNRLYPRNNWYRWNYMRYPRNSAVEENQNVEDNREKRETQDTERPKRWGFDNPVWYGNGWNWNQWMDNQWNPWYNNYMRYPRNSDVKADEDGNSEVQRTKRDAEDNDRTKRWGYGNPMWFGNGQNWNQWMNNQWNPWYNNYMRFARESDDSESTDQDITREKRDAEEETPRQKRFGMWNMMNPWSGQRNWNGMWNRLYPRNNWYRWNYMRYPRNSAGKADDEGMERTKRAAEDNDRTKRWGYGNPMWFGNGQNWNQWMNNQWNPWNNNYMRFARESDGSVTDDKTDKEIEKRAADEDTPRQKRFGMWNMMNPWSGQGNWNGMWNRLYPRNNWYRWNYMRYPRNSAVEENQNVEDNREKRETQDTERPKRWGFDNPVWYGNGWNWNQWMDNQWNPWYNNYMRYPRNSDVKADEDGNAEVQRTKRDAEDNDRTKRWGYGNPMWFGNGQNWNQWMNNQWNPWYNNYMRFARESDDPESTDQDITREKRDADEETPRQKRFGMRNMMDPWSGHGHWNGMWNRLYPRNNWYRWNHMRYPRNSAGKADDEGMERTKRAAEDNDRTKRWGYGNPMLFGNGQNRNQWMNNQWNPWYNSYMRFARESDDPESTDQDITREKRDAEEETPRQKRFGMWNMMNPWSGQRNWNGMWNRWYPRNNWYRWNHMRYPRNSAGKADDEGMERTKRAAEDNDRSKRWGYGNPMWFGNGQNWNQWMNNQWNPWYNNYMRFARESDDSVTDDKTDKEIEKRAADEDTPRQKRFGMWNMMNPWSGQRNWNGMWNRLYPRNNWYRWNYMRYPRNSAVEENQNVEDNREKRETQDTERPKRWGFDNPVWYGNGWNWNQWMDNQWNPWYNNYMRYPRNSDVKADEDGNAEVQRTKRDAEDHDRTKRWGYGNPMWFGKNGQNWNQWMNNQWNPWYNNYMRFARESDDSESTDQDITREKRDADEETPRQKRFGMWNMMNPWSGQGNWNGMWNRLYPRNNWYRWNYMRYPRNSAGKADDEGMERTKRAAEDNDRTKRRGYGNPMWFGNGPNWNQWMNNQWNPWYNNYMRFARESDGSVTDDKTDKEIEKRAADEDTPRQKRFGMWNMMNPWSGHGNWNGMWNRLYPRNNWYRWNYMRYPRNSAVEENQNVEDNREKRETQDTERPKRWGFDNPVWYGNGWNWNQWMDNQWNPWYNNYMRYPRNSDVKADEDGNAEVQRTKRDAEDNDRTKRWGYGNPMWFGNGQNRNQWMNNQWNPWYNNYMRFARESDDPESTDQDITREKRDADEETPRQKRFGMWSMMNPWSGQGNWNGMWNRLYPRNNWYRWNYMRYPRNSAGKADDEGMERTKRAAEDNDRTKRWGYGNPMLFGNGQNWNQWMNNQWNPWYNNYMRFARESDDSESTDQDIHRDKRDAEEETPRQKRFGMWNMMYPWSGQGNWNGNGWKWNQWMDYQRNPWYNNYMRFGRESSANKQSRLRPSLRNKRATSQVNLKAATDFQKRLVGTKKNAFTTSFANGRFGSRNQDRMKPSRPNKQEMYNKETGRKEWMDESRISQGDGNAWSSKWRRWMGTGGMDSSFRRQDNPWLVPRSPWMWQMQQWGNPMMQQGNPWFHHRGWW